LAPSRGELVLKHKHIGLILLFWVEIYACGYHLPQKAGFPEGVDLIFVEVLENQTTESGAENIVTRNLINEFTLRKTKNLAGRLEKADAILSGAVSEVSIRTIAFEGQDSASERRVTVSVDLALKKKDGKVIWALKGLSDNQAYPVSQDKNVTEANKRIAMDIASKRIAERALNRLTDNF
jgi:outer membrane lipopolysaccharide assembly protein LptE/RlpB